MQCVVPLSLVLWGYGQEQFVVEPEDKRAFATPTRPSVFGTLTPGAQAGEGRPKSPADLFNQPRAALQSQMPPEVGKIVEVGSGLFGGTRVNTVPSQL